MFFIIPMDRWSLIGTTDTKYDGDLDEVHADGGDVDYLLAESRRVLPGLNLSRRSILYTYAGIRPLAFAGGQESRISRKHRVVLEGRTGRIITIAGGKYTTYRNMAEDAVDAACRKLGRRSPCMTGKKPLAGSLPAGLEEYTRDSVPQMAQRYEMPPETVSHLIRLYGTRAERVLLIAKDDPRMGAAVSSDCRDIYAQVLYAIREEGAKTLCDIVLRRMLLGITADRGEAQISSIAEIAARELKWTAGERESRVEEFREELKKEKRF
jgi:glycerol-3-phosphate dehydrogenase